MDQEEIIKENQLLKKENEELKNKVLELEEHLKKYNNSRKSYYEKNKDLVNQKAKERLKKIAEENPDKIKEYAKRAYQNKKAKLEKAKLEGVNI